MKKFLVGSLVLLFVFIVAVSAIRADEEESDPVSSSPFIGQIVSSYCKTDIEYTEWTPCDKRFGKNGIQYRQIVYPTFNGCLPTTAQQVAQQRECLK